MLFKHVWVLVLVIRRAVGYVLQSLLKTGARARALLGGGAESAGLQRFKNGAISPKELNLRRFTDEYLAMKLHLPRGSSQEPCAAGRRGVGKWSCPNRWSQVRFTARSLLIAPTSKARAS